MATGIKKMFLIVRMYKVLPGASGMAEGKSSRRGINLVIRK